ncbi:MAG TPA: APC family permease [Terriglobales bacterium]|nr:APC family permease [Terriglobales bacterium]
MKAAPGQQHLVRGIGLREGISLNMIAMIGVGPFITIPLIIHASGGPQAMLGWVLGAVLAICDGMVWAELGAALPRAGGSYEYLKEIYGPQRLGRLFSFLYVWQLMMSAPLSAASGCVGIAQYATFIFPSLQKTIAAHTFGWNSSWFGHLGGEVAISWGTFLAMAACVVAIALAYRRVDVAGKISTWLLGGVSVAIAWVIWAGVTHFNAARAFDFPPSAFQLNQPFLLGLGSAMLIATYDYWGYYDIAYMGAEVRDPGRTIPRSILYAILIVAAIYIVMNISILGVVPWRELDRSAATGSHFYVVSTMMQRIYGTRAGQIAAVLIIWTAFASVFSVLLGVSRIPYAAALDGNFFRAFAHLDAKGKFPTVALLWMGALTCVLCMFRLVDLIAALVIIRILMQFILQAVGVMIYRAKRPEVERPFRMWLYPLPALEALAGFIYILISRPNFQREILLAAVLIVVGVAAYLIRANSKREWPFAGPIAVSS